MVNGQQLNNPIQLEHLSDRELLVLAVQAINQLKLELAEMATDLKVQNGRIRSLESWRNVLTGGMAVLMFLLSTFGVFVLSRIL